LFALLEAMQVFSWETQTFWGTLTVPRAIRLFTIGIFGVYLFGVQPLSLLIPGFFPMRWSYFRGLWIWIIPLYVFSLYVWSKRNQWRRFLAPERLRLIR